MGILQIEAALEGLVSAAKLQVPLKHAQIYIVICGFNLDILVFPSHITVCFQLQARSDF